LKTTGQRWIFTITALLVIAFPLFQEPLLAFEKTEADRLFKFAGQLFAEEDYYRAITEYKRFLSYYPDDPRGPLCRLNIALSYMEGGKTDLAVHDLKEIRKDLAGSKTAEKAAYEIGRAYFQTGRYEEAKDAFSEFLRHYPESKWKDGGQAYIAWSLLHLGAYKKASRSFSEISGKSPYAPFARALSEKLAAGIKIPHKSPALAGTLSAFLPGAGQFYTNRPREGITSFVLNGSFIWAIVELFGHGNEVAGVLLGFFETGWYSGGIFGAVNDAHKFNRKAKADFLEELRMRYPLPAEQ
jgi:tetratricopeptide (TPR) repeat protein